MSYQPLTSTTIKIGNKEVGSGHKVYIIAEVSANHRSDFDHTLGVIEQAKEAGADAVKFQHLKGKLIAADTVMPGTWNGKPIGALSDFYTHAEMPYEWTQKLADHAKKIGIDFISTPFDTGAVDILADAGVPAFKVASYELTDDVLLAYIASKNKPVIISTGMAYLEEVKHAVDVIRQVGNTQIAVLHCVSMYPPQFEDLNLRAITTLQKELQLPIGFSDHSRPPYVAASIAAVTLGACIIERHITNSREGGSNDDPNSMEFAEFKRFVEEIRNTKAALSRSGIKEPVSRPDRQVDEISERKTRRGIYAVRALSAGETLSASDIITLRPAAGIEPKDIKNYFGKVLTKPVGERQAITPEHFT